MSCIVSGRSLLFSCVLAGSIAFSLPSHAQDIDTQIRQHFVAAQQAQQQGHLDAAVEEYKAILRLQPDIPQVYANLGLVYYAEAKFADSAQALATADKLKPDMRGVSLWLGIDEVKLDRPLLGVAHLRQALRQNPSDKLAQVWLSTALWDAGKMDESLAQLRKANAQFPDDPDLLFALGEAYGKAVHQETDQLLEQSKGTALSDRIYASLYFEEHDWTKAEGHLRRAIERDPRSLPARLELAQVFLAQARLPDAKQQLDQAVQLAPHSAAALARRGQVLILMQQPASGLAQIEMAIGIDRSEALNALGLPVEDNVLQADAANPQLAAQCRAAALKLQADAASGPAQNAAIAALYALAGDNAAAMQAYRRIGSGSPASVHSGISAAGSPFVRAMTAYDRHRYEEAEAALLRWLALHPADEDARYDLLRVRRRLAMAQIDRLVTIAPDSYHVHQLLGELYVDREEDDKALAEYQAVAAARPDLPDVHFWLGHLYWKHGDADHALAELTRQLQLDPGHPEANGELGAVLVAEDRPKEAIPHLELAIQRKPDLWPAYTQLGRAYASEKQYARAEDVLRRGLAHDPDGLTHYQLGLVLRAEGKTAEARQAFAELRAIKNEKMAAPSGAEADDAGAKP